ncbi:MAG TPA: putative Ig domain-containing protein, partial [Blastocatellia bacterium]|nr:putative Ig domain-containing protein [Blastocatellia bacterium]
MGRVHRRTWTKLFVFFFLLFSAAGIASATTVIVPSDDDMIIGARAIIRGKVLSVGSALDAQQGRIFTYITVRVQEVYKGEVRARKIVLKQEGGQVGERGSVVFGTPQFTPGERVLLYLESWPDGSLRTHQLFLGKFTISADPQTGKKYVARSAPDENTTVLQSGGSGQTATVRVEYSTYIKMLREGIAANLERSRIFEETYYRNIPMLMQPPEYQERADKGAIEPQYTFIGNPPVRWFEPDAGQPVVFQVNLDQAPFPQTMEDINAAMAAWSNIAGCSLRIVNGGAAGVCFPSNETNTIIFNNCDNRWPITACSGTLAIGGLSWKSETKVVNGVIFRRATHGFISFNPYARCSYSSPCDLREIATHELGHTIGLGHSPFGDATMAAYAHFDGRCASLRDDDRNGAIFMYPSASGGGGPLAITTASPLPDGTVASPYAQTLAASGGTPPYSWSLVSGALPPGVGMDATGAISGTPTTTGTYNFTVQVTDAAQTPAQKSFSITINSSSYAAQFVSQNVPSRVTTGQQFSFNIKFNNTGSAAWSEADGVRIGSQNPPDNTTWGGNRVILPAGFVIAPGQQLDVAVQAIAPATPGTYNFQWQMVKEGGSFFGDLSPNLEITVTSPNTVVINGPTLIKAVQGVPVSQAYTAAGGAEPYTWSIASGALPPGMSLHAGNGTISGTPTATGNFTLTLQAADSASRTAQLPVTVTVSPPPLTIEEPARPEAVKGLSFTFRLNA